MAKHSSVGSIYIGVCKCCLSDGSYMDMWGEYFFNGEREIYGEMLAVCFGSLWQEVNEEENGVDLICEACVKRLRDAYHFRSLIITSRDTMTSFFKTETMDEVERDPKNLKKELEDYEEVEYLEDINEDGDESMNLSRIEKYDNTESEPTKRKWPKKKKRSEIKRPYFNYSMEDLKNSIEMVKEKKLSVQKASKLYNVPKSSINNWMRNENRDKNLPKDQKQLNTERHHKFMAEVKQLLEYTNATIYKSRATRLHCAYCSPAQSKALSSGDELREHVIKEHLQDRISRVDLALRPHWFYEIIKLDIDGLRCTDCDLAIPNWPDLFEHLNSEHGLVFTEVQSKLVPYILDESNRCALCNKHCKNYHMLDAHMNSHYKNFICNKCGDTFLTSMRLMKHIETHGSGRHPCDLCGKVFSLAKYMRKHRRQYHALEPFMKCLYCDDKFHRSHDRHLHVVDQHPDKVKYITCEICGKTFDWSPYYFAHMRKNHNQEYKHKCEECDNTFETAALLQRHSHRHKSKKEFQCELCPKSYTTKYILAAHRKLHEYEGVDIKNVTLLDKFS